MQDDFLDRLRTALESQNVNRLAELLAPDVTWGAPGDPNPPCRNSDQVIRWYQDGFDNGVRTTVREVTPLGDNVLVGLSVTGNPAAGDADGAVDRWEVLAITDGLVSDIRGFEDRESAVAHAGRTT